MMVNANKKNFGTGTIIKNLSKSLNFIGSFVIIILMLFTVTNVFLRFFFDSPMLGTYEMVGYLMVIVVYFCFPYTEINKSNVFIDFVINLFPLQWKTAVKKLFALPLSFITAALICWQMLMKTKTAFARGEVSSVLSIPVYPFSFFAAIGIGVLAILLLSELVNYISLSLLPFLRNRRIKVHK